MNKKNFVIWLNYHWTLISPLVVLICGGTIYWCAKAGFDGTPKGFILLFCQLIPVMIMYLNTRSRKFVKGIALDVLVVFTLLDVLCVFISSACNLWHEDKFYVYYICTCMFSIVFVYLLEREYMLLKSQSKYQDDYYKAFCLYQGLMFVSYISACLAFLGYFGVRGHILDAFLILLIGVVTNVAFTVAVSMAIADMRVGDVLDKEGKEDT